MTYAIHVAAATAAPGGRGRCGRHRPSASSDEHRSGRCRNPGTGTAGRGPRGPGAGPAKWSGCGGRHRRSRRRGHGACRRWPRRRPGAGRSPRRRGCRRPRPARSGGRRPSSAAPPDTVRTPGAVAVVGRVPPGPAFRCVAASSRREGRAPRAVAGVPAGTRWPACPRLRFGRRAGGRSRGNALAACPRLRSRRRAPERSRGNAVAACPRVRPGRRAGGRSRGNAVAACPRVRSGCRAPGRSRGNVPPFSQCLRVLVQHHLIRVAGRPPVESARPTPPRRGSRWRPPAVARASAPPSQSSRRPLPLPPWPTGRPLLLPRRRPTPARAARRLQCPPQHRPHLRRQTPPDNHHPVLVHPRPQPPARLLPPFLRLLRVPVDAPPRPGYPFHVRRRAREGRVEQGLLVLRRGHPRDRPHLRVGDLAAAHGVAQLRQLPEGPRHSDVLAGRPRREPGPPAQPVGARQATIPALLLVSGENARPTAGETVRRAILAACRTCADAPRRGCQAQNAGRDKKIRVAHAVSMPLAAIFGWSRLARNCAFRTRLSFSWTSIAVS